MIQAHETGEHSSDKAVELNDDEMPETGDPEEDEPATAPAPRWGAWLALALGVFAAGAAALTLNAAPGISFHDSGEFALAARSAGVAHPPGAPTWTILASLFIRLGRWGDAARGANLFSALCGALTLGLAALLAQMWTWLAVPRRHRLAGAAAGLAAPLTLLHSPAFLEQSFIAEQYTLLTALLGLTLIPVTLLHPAWGGAPSRRLGLALAAGVLAGLAIGNHPSQIVLAGLLACAAWVGAPREGRRLAPALRLGGAAGAGLGLGLMVYLWVPLRSHANPLLDWGNIKTFQRFVWAAAREQWGTRSILAAPPGFVREWLATWRFGENLGPAGLALGLGGVAALARRRRAPLAWLAAVTLPYAACLLIGHMHQAGIEIDYIHTYGVMDWHLPLYQAGALLAGVGAGWLAHWLSGRVGRRGAQVALAALALTMLFAVSSRLAASSLRRFTAPEAFTDALLAPLPEGAIVLVHADNVANLMSWRAYGSAGGKGVGGRFIAPCLLNPAHWLPGDAPGGLGWSRERKLNFFKNTMTPENQPLRIGTMAPAEVARRPLVIDGGVETAWFCQYLVPAGLLYEVRETPVSNAEALAADRRWQAAHPGLIPRPGPQAHRLERSAWAALLSARGQYFMHRGMWSEAAEAFERSTQWFEESAPVRHAYGYVLEALGRPVDAREQLRKALEIDPHLAGPRTSLAIDLARAGEFDRAEALLKEELKIHPEDRDTFKNLELVRSNRAATARRSGGHGH